MIEEAEEYRLKRKAEEAPLENNQNFINF